MAAEQGGHPSEPIHLPAEIDWDMLDKSRFFFLGAALFSGISVALYPAIVLKTRLQICQTPLSCFREAAFILRHEGSYGFYRGFATSLAGTIPARALYMTALEFTKSTVGSATSRLGVPDPAAAAASNAAAGLSASVAAQIVWTPIDVVSQRLMVQGSEMPLKYRGGIDAFLKILRSDGFPGLYRGFGMSILTYAPSSAVWWASYSTSQRIIWGGVGLWFSRRDSSVVKPGYGTVAAVQGASAAIAGGAAALVTMPLDTVKTRMQVMDGGDDGGKRMMTIRRTVRSLLREGGWMACYKGLGPRWASMSLSSVTMITTYEFLKRLSAKKQRSFN
ncbi:solute carrier family 25 member 44-like [Phalaenopsis equestris]|uniref:solute carrier family 25 member 44-like n=1 Tax=Phalaenopsis equestris TaxID=78828 RepID=UPI0009E2DD6A|nr:solute carrier family 25 member 44-like [Phalaenopsis equestris]